MADRAELLRAVSEQIARLQKVEEGKLAPSSTDSAVGVLTDEQNVAVSLVRALEDMRFGFTFEGKPVE